MVKYSTKASTDAAVKLVKLFSVMSVNERRDAIRFLLRFFRVRPSGEKGGS